MTPGFALLVLLLVFYAAFSGAILWHFNIYSFSRSARVVSSVFVILALVFGAATLYFFNQVPWTELWKEIAGSGGI